MEGKVRTLRLNRLTGMFSVLLLLSFATEQYAQEPNLEPSPDEKQKLTLRKNVRAREYHGREVEGEDRVIGPGDSLWRMLVQQQGVPQKRFKQYLVIIRGLNPHIRNLNVLKVGETIFVPLHPDELLAGTGGKASGSAPAVPRATTRDYRVKAGERLYSILRRELGLKTERDLATYYALVRDLNPQKKKWDVLLEGEWLRLPVREDGPGSTAQAKNESRDRPQTSTAENGEAAVGARHGVPLPVPPDGAAGFEGRSGSTVAAEKAPELKGAFGLDYPNHVRANENIALLTQVMEALGNQVQRTGEEVFRFKDGVVHLDKNKYPIVYNPKLQQKIVLDTREDIPAAIRAKLSDGNITVPVLSVSNESTLQATVSQLLSALGYQPLPNDRPVVVSDASVTFEVRGNWMAMAPEESNKPQEVFVLTLSERPDEIAPYLQQELSRRGLHLKDVVLSAPAGSAGGGNTVPEYRKSVVRRWPSEKIDFVDAVLSAFGVSFGTAEPMSLTLSDGLRIEIKSDRVFETQGKRMLLLFKPVASEIKAALQERQGVTVHELDISTLSRKDIVSRLLEALGEKAAYGEHRFAASNGANKDRLHIAAPGFLLPQRGMFITDKDIPETLHQFFFEKGLEIVYF